MNPFHTLGGAGQGQLDQIKTERGPEQGGYGSHFLQKILTVRADVSFPLSPLQKAEMMPLA